MNENQNAEQIVWDASGPVQMSLIPETGGSLEVRVEDGAGAVIVDAVDDLALVPKWRLG